MLVITRRVAIFSIALYTWCHLCKGRCPEPPQAPEPEEQRKKGRTLGAAEPLGPNEPNGAAGPWGMAILHGMEWSFQSLPSGYVKIAMENHHF